MAKTIALVSCVGKKHKASLPAKELYISDWFHKASFYAEQYADQWFILSAKHHLLDPNKVIKTYDVTLNRVNTQSRKAWAQRVLEDLNKNINPGDKVIILAGAKYREYLVDPLRAMGCIIDIPMEGLRIGEQLGWLKQRIRG